MRILIFILCMCSLPVFGQITAVSIAYKQSTNSSSTLTTTTTIGATAIHVAVGYYQFGSSTAITLVDNQSCVWVQDTVVKLAGDAGVVTFHCSTCNTSATHTFSVNTSPIQYPAIAVLSTSGEVAAGAKDKATGKTSSSSTLTGTSLTPSANGALILAAYNGSGTAINATPSGYTIIGSQSGNANSAGLYFGYKVQTTASAETPSWTLAASNSQVEITVAFKQSTATRCTSCDYFIDD